MNANNQSVLRVLAISFSLVILLLVAAAGVSVRHARSLQNSIAVLSAEQNITTGLATQLQNQRSLMSGVFYRLLRHSELAPDDAVFQQLDMLDDALENLSHTEDPGERGRKWGELIATAKDFSLQARQLTRDNKRDYLLLEPLFVHHQKVMKLTEDLTLDASRSAMATEGMINGQAEFMNRIALGLLVTCLALSVLCAALTLRFAAQAMRRMEEQASHLNRVSWQLLHSQEETARRFSHELHDELGQSLTAVKANLVSLGSGDFELRRADCLALLESCTGSVRELSPLLHPVILDDFGLGAALRWLCDGFGQRTGIPVEYLCTFEGRLDERLETNIFRIAQESLTNIARHAGASAVKVELMTEAPPGYILLRVGDNGKGFERPAPHSLASVANTSLGLGGMRARTLHSNGTLSIKSARGQGTVIPARFPVEIPADEPNPQDSYFARR